MSKSALTLLATCSLLLGACAHGRPPDRIEDLLSQAFQAAENHHEFDLDAEAAALLGAIAQVDPDFPGVQELSEDLDPDARAGMQRSLLGMNRKLRPSVQRPLWARLLLFLPDRVLDLLDVVTFDVHFGLGAFADVHATRAIQASAGARTTGGLGLHDHRSLGMKSQAEAGVSAILLGAQSYSGGLVGTSGALGAAGSSVGLHEPTDPLYQSFRDYWGVGASVTAAILGAEIEFHPIQLADFLAGWFWIDFLRDDFAHTRALKLDYVEQRMVVELWQLQDSQELLQAYAAAKEQGALSHSSPQAPPPPVVVPDGLRMRPSEKQRLQLPAAIAP